MTDQIRFDGFEQEPKKQVESAPEKAITCCFTGHREIEHSKELYTTVRAEIERAYANGYRIFCTGGALGFDTVAALNVLAVRQTAHSDIQLHLILPYKDQASRWNEYDKHMYNSILKRADRVEYHSEHYTDWCMFTRNRRLVELSSLCICYMTEDKGGTKFTVELATKKGLTVINLATAK